MIGIREGKGSKYEKERKTVAGRNDGGGDPHVVAGLCRTAAEPVCGGSQGNFGDSRRET